MSPGIARARRRFGAAFGAAAMVTAALAGCARHLAWRMPSPDHRIQVELRSRGDMTCVRVGGRLEGCFDGVAGSGLTFSPDSRHLAYPVATHARWRVVRDGRAGSEWDQIAGLAFSPDGDHLVYAARDGRSWRLVQDERPGEAWDSLYASSITMSAPGAHVAFVAVREGAAHGVRDGGAGPPYERIQSPRFSPGGARFAYVAWRGDRAALVVDDHAGPVHDFIDVPVFSADSRSVACAVRDSSAWFLIQDGVASGPFASARMAGFSGAGNTLVAVVGTAAGEAVRAGDAVGPSYAAVADPVISRDRRRWGYLARRGDSSVVVLDGAIRTVEEQASNLVLSDDGARHAYLASRAGRVCVVDDVGAHPYELLIDGSLGFSRGGKWACLAGNPSRRRLFVTAEGCRRRRAFDWTMIARLARSQAATPGDEPMNDTVRAWIAAEAERIRARE